MQLVLPLLLVLLSLPPHLLLPAHVCHEELVLLLLVEAPPRVLRLRLHLARLVLEARVLRCVHVRQSRHLLINKRLPPRLARAESLLLAVAQHRPSMVLLMDEVDAALDEVNAKRVAELLKEISKTSQVIAISHRVEFQKVADHFVELRKNGSYTAVGGKKK